MNEAEWQTRKQRIEAKKVTVNLWLVVGLMLLAGCVNQAGQAPDQASGRVSVSFPNFKLAHHEYVQSIDLAIRAGRVAAINCFLDDWDVELVWDNPELLNLKMQARHFSSGLPDLSVLDDFVTIENSAGSPFILTAKLLTDSTDPTGRGEKQYVVSREEFILKPVRHVRNRARAHDGKTSIPGIAIIGKVQVGYSTQEDLERRWGRGKTVIGGHPNSGRRWRVEGTPWVLNTDGFEYSQRGLVVDSVSLQEDHQPGQGVPFARLKAGELAWLGEISLGMSEARVKAILEQRGLPMKQTPAGFEIEAKGHHALVSHGSFQTWTAGCGFTNGALNTLQIDACP